jgi:hypothetical protein
MEVETKHGKLTFKRGDIRNILFPPPAAKGKEFKIEPTGKWLDTGIMLKKGDKLTITADGGLEFSITGAKYRPDGTLSMPENTALAPEITNALKDKKYPLVARIGEKGSEFKTGSSFNKQVDQEGTLFLRIEIPEGAKKVTSNLKGSYKVKIVLPDKSAAKPTPKQEQEAARELAKAQYFDKANPYEDKEIVAAKYEAVAQKYPGTEAAKKATEKAKEVMQRRK